MASVERLLSSPARGLDVLESQELIPETQATELTDPEFDSQSLIPETQLEGLLIEEQTWPSVIPETQLPGVTQYSNLEYITPSRGRRQNTPQSNTPSKRRKIRTPLGDRDPNVYLPAPSSVSKRKKTQKSPQP